MSDNESTNAESPSSPKDLPAICSTPASGADEQRGAEAPSVSTKLELLAKLECLSGLGAAGIVPPARVNAAHNCLRTVLQYVGNDDTPSGAGVIADDDALKTLRENPELLKLMRPLLTAEQLKLIIREASSD